jgi:hypothetical protein
VEALLTEVTGCLDAADLAGGAADLPAGAADPAADTADEPAPLP